ncbi:MAG TPA: hypothetical protein VGN56_00240 [Candidatus Paceibacterota bacterium]|jgi:SAM-dependent methyltransferase|nr:hypothetical protein [Candidatus Paceibacterota bacterium]
MTYIVLDIGAGSRAFGLDLAIHNRTIPMSIFCGEPRWGIGPFSRAISEKNKDEIIEQHRRGVWRLISRYQRFAFEDASLDLITLNAPHPFHGFRMQVPLAKEIDRCLRPGGMFFSSYPRTDFGAVLKGYELLIEGSWGHGGKPITFPAWKLPAGVPTRFPQSPTIIHNIRVHQHGNPRAMGTQYIYFDGISPGYRLWKKPEG